MIDTAFERHGVAEARLLAAGDDPIALLSALLRDSGARVTFDLGASYHSPCTTCGAPGPHELVRIGTYPNGDPIRRPVCERHRLGFHLRGCEPDDKELQVLAAYHAETCSRWTGKAACTCGAKGLVGGPYTLRHTFASHFLKNRPDMFLLAEVMGHSHTRVTKLYAHLLPDHLEAARDVVSFAAPVGPARLEARKRWRAAG